MSVLFRLVHTVQAKQRPSQGELARDKTWGKFQCPSNDRLSLSKFLLTAQGPDSSRNAAWRNGRHSRRWIAETPVEPLLDALNLVEPDLLHNGLRKSPEIQKRRVAGERGCLPDHVWPGGLSLSCRRYLRASECLAPVRKPRDCLPGRSQSGPPPAM